MAHAAGRRAGEPTGRPGLDVAQAAEAWRRAGDRAREEQVLRDFLRDRRDGSAASRQEWWDRCLAWSLLIMLLAESGRADEADEEIARLEAAGPAHNAAVAVAMILKIRGDLAGALRWSELAVTSWGGGTVDGALRRLLLWRDRWEFSGADLRADLRASLGLPPDALDQAVARILRDAEQTSEPAAREIAGPPRVQGLFWTRARIGDALARFDLDLDPAEVASGAYWRDLEHRWARLSERAGVPSLELVPLDPVGLAALAEAEGVPIDDEDLRFRHADDQVQRGRAIEWPPARNAPCWCGSAAKYKKCCGRASNR